MIMKLNPLSGFAKSLNTQSRYNQEKGNNDVVLHCPELDLDGLSHLLQMDAGTGNLSINTAIINSDSNMIPDLISNSRSNFAVQQAYYGNPEAVSFVKLTDLTFPEEFIFENSIDGNVFRKGFTDELLNQHVQNKLFEHVKRLKGIKTGHHAKLNPVLIKNPPDILRKTVFGYNQIDYKDIESIERIAKKIDFYKLNIRNRMTKEFRPEILETDMVKQAISISSKLTSLRKLCNSLNIPTVGVLRSHPGDTVFYMLSHFRSDENDLSAIYKSLSTVYKINFESQLFRSFLKDCSRLCLNRDTKCYTTLLISKPNNKKNICVFSVSTFDKSLNTSQTKSSLILKMREHVQKKLGWQTWSIRGDYITTFI